MENKFRLKTGELTQYSLACGYIFRVDDNKKSLTLWREHSVFHVRLTNRKNPVESFWKVFDYNQLTSAKKLYYKTAREVFNFSKQKTILKACYSD
jgi:hypothetical protein